MVPNAAAVAVALASDIFSAHPNKYSGFGRRRCLVIFCPPLPSSPRAARLTALRNRTPGDAEYTRLPLLCHVAVTAPAPPSPFPPTGLLPDAQAEASPARQSALSQSLPRLQLQTSCTRPLLTSTTSQKSRTPSRSESIFPVARRVRAASGTLQLCVLAAVEYLSGTCCRDS